MADLATTGAADASGFADGEVREVVVEDELLLCLATGIGIKLLRVFVRAESDEADRLGFAANKQGGTMGAGENASFARDRADGIKATAVEALAIVQNEAANGFLLDVVEGVLDDELGDFLRAEFLDEFHADFVLNGFARAFTGELAGRQQGRDETVASEGLGFLEDFVGNDVQRDLALGLAGFGGEFLLRGDQRLTAFLAELERGIKVSLGDFLGCAFEHHDVLFVADIDEVEVAFSAFVVIGVGDELAIDASDANRAQRTAPRNVADHQRCRCADDAENVRIVLAVRAEQDGLDLDFVIPALGEERANRAVGETAGEDFLFCGTTFALEVAAGKLSSSSSLLAVIDGQREEVLSVLRLGGGDSGDDDDRFAELNGDGTVGLLGQLAGFDGDLFIADLGGYFFGHIC